jgi:hypothetical protein
MLRNEYGSFGINTQVKKQKKTLPKRVSYSVSQLHFPDSKFEIGQESQRQSFFAAQKCFAERTFLNATSMVLTESCTRNMASSIPLQSYCIRIGMLVKKNFCLRIEAIQP